MRKFRELFWEPMEAVEKLSSGYQSEMSGQQLAFLLGVLREHKPKKLLEIGVAAGGTTAAIL